VSPPVAAAPAPGTGSTVLASNTPISTSRQYLTSTSRQYVSSTSRHSYLPIPLATPYPGPLASTSPVPPQYLASTSPVLAATSPQARHAKARTSQPSLMSVQTTTLLSTHALANPVARCLPTLLDRTLPVPYSIHLRTDGTITNESAEIKYVLITSPAPESMASLPPLPGRLTVPSPRRLSLPLRWRAVRWRRVSSGPRTCVTRRPRIGACWRAHLSLVRPLVCRWRISTSTTRANSAG
jgi:hypothetical protein